MAGQVRAYAEFLDSTLPVLVDETITEPVGPEPLHPLRVKEPRPRRAGQRRPPRWVYAVAAAVATVLLIGAFGVAILLLGNESEVIDTPPTVVTTLPPITPTTASPPTTTAPLPPRAAPTVAFAAEGWQRHDVSPDAFGNEQFLFITEIVEWNGRLHAVGSAAGGVPSERPIIWASEDGVEWTRTFVGSREDFITAVIPGGPGLVAVGYSATVWVSGDGVTWVESRLDIPDMRDITVVDDRLFAVASYVSPETADELQLPPLYFSDDGVTWTGIPRTNFEPPQNGKLSQLYAVVSGPAGLVAYGDNAVDDTGPSETDTNYRPDAGFWSSTDGTTWTWANVPTHLTGGLIAGPGGNALAGGPRGYVAYRQLSERIVDGDVVDASDIVLFSQDGSQWEIGLELHEDSDMRITSVAATAEGFIATGVDHNRQRGVIWTSPDGVTWTLVSEDQSMFDNVAIDGVWPTATGLIALSHIGVQCAEIPQLPDCPPVIFTWSPGGQ